MDKIGLKFNFNTFRKLKYSQNSKPNKNSNKFEPNKYTILNLFHLYNILQGWPSFSET